MSDIEIYYNAICKKWPKPMPSWGQLDPQQQIMFLQAFNLLIGALN